MKTFRIHYRLNGENQTIDLPSDNSTTASNKFLGRFSEGERRPVIKKIKILASEPTICRAAKVKFMNLLFHILSFTGWPPPGRKLQTVPGLKPKIRLLIAASLFSVWVFLAKAGRLIVRYKS